MVLINIEADWDERYERMQVTFEAESEQWIERMTARQWRKFIYEIKHGGSLRLGGIAIGIDAKMSVTWEVLNGIRNYLYRVDEAFVANGNTRLLREHLECDLKKLNG